MFIINSPASFDLWLKENLVKHQKVSKYYEHDCSIINFEYDWPHELPNSLRITMSGNVGTIYKLCGDLPY